MKEPEIAPKLTWDVRNSVPGRLVMSSWHPRLARQDARALAALGPSLVCPGRAGPFAGCGPGPALERPSFSFSLSHALVKELWVGRSPDPWLPLPSCNSLCASATKLISRSLF